MTVSSPLELYTVYLGWRQYDVIWQACIQFGLAWVPFLGLFVENLTKPFETPFGNGTETSFRRVFIELLLMCVVIMFCVYPWMSLQTSDVTYTPYCAKGATQSTVGNSGTTYDNVFASAVQDNVKVPGLFGLMMNWTSGFTNALIAGSIPCESSITHLMHQVITSRLTPDLQQQVTRFNNECYLKARSNFDSQNPDLDTYQSTLKAYGGESDLNWMGSHVLRQLYYSNIYAEAPVTGFSYSAFPSTYVNDAVQKGEMTQPEWGYPTCEQWWTDSQHGLESQIVSQVDKATPQNPHLGALPLSDQVQNWLREAHITLGNSTTSDDIIARGLLYDTKGDYGGFTTGQASVDTDSGVSGAMAKPFVELGQTLHQFTQNSFKRAALSQILPIIQALAIFFLLVFSPLIQIFGRYRLGVSISLCFMLMSLIFLNYIWALLGYLQTGLDNSLLDPTTGDLLGQNSTLNNFMTVMYFAAPALYMTLMGAAGIKIGAAFNGFMGDGASFATQAGNEGSGTIGAVTKVVSMGLK